MRSARWFTLAGGKTRVIGIVMVNFYNPFFADICHAIETYAVRRGYEIEISNAHTDMGQILPSVHRFLGQKVAGLALFPENEPNIIEALRNSNIPVLLYDCGEPAENISVIHFDHRKGSRMRVDLLYALGHRRMAFIAASAARPSVEAVQFPKPTHISSTAVFWIDSGECKLPESWRVLYRDGSVWKPVENRDPYATARDRFKVE